MKKVSIIVPIYNGEKYIDTCLKNILLQTINDYEIICINDGSIDGTNEILQRYALNYENIRVINKNNQGTGAARNDGIRSAEGEYIAFMDVDDYYPDENVVKVLYETAKNNGADICGGYIDSKGLKKGDVFERFSQQGYVLTGEKQVDYGFYRFMYRKKLLIENSIFFPERSVFEDPIFLVNALHAAKKYYMIDRCVYMYTESHHKDLSVEQTLQYLKGLKEMLHFAEANNYDELYKKNFKRLESEGQYFAEKNYSLNSDEIFRELVILNGILRKDKLDLPNDYILPALKTINGMARKYEKVRRNPLVKIIKKVWK